MSERWPRTRREDINKRPVASPVAGVVRGHLCCTRGEPRVVRAEALQRLHRGHLCTCGKTRVEGVEASWRPRANTTSCQQHLMGKSQSGHGQVTVRSQSGLSQVSVRSTVRSTVRSGFSMGKSICVRPPTKSLYHVYIHACLKPPLLHNFGFLMINPDLTVDLTVDLTET